MVVGVFIPLKNLLIENELFFSLVNFVEFPSQNFFQFLLFHFARFPMRGFRTKLNLMSLTKRSVLIECAVQLTASLLVELFVLVVT